MAHRSNSSSSESVCRIVLLGKTGAVKSRVTRILLGGTEAEGKSGLCVIRRGNVAERNVCLVEAPGWERMQRTSKKVQHEIIRSVTLCSTGPHALILVLPVSRGDVSSENEIKAAVRHTELLSERVWNHTVVLFLCDQDVDQAAIKQHLEVSGKLLEKCGGRHYVLKGEDSETQRQELFKEIDELVEKNCGDCFLPQVYYELMQSKIPKDLTDLIKSNENREKQLKEAHQKTSERYETQLVQEKEAHQKTLEQHKTQLVQEKEAHQKTSERYETQLVQEKEAHQKTSERYETQLVQEKEAHLKTSERYETQLVQEKEAHQKTLEQHKTQLVQEREAHQKTLEQHKTQLVQEREAHQKIVQQHKTEVEELEKNLKQRQGSMNLPPPYMGPDEKKSDVKDDLIKMIRSEVRSLARNFFKPAAVVVVAIIGALVGSVVGSAFGVLGSGLGIFIGALVTFPIALKVIDAVMRAREVSPPQKKEDTSTKDAS